MPIEICFVRWICLPSSEWAAWWQGIGTVMAVFVAIGLSLNQRASEITAKAQHELETRRRAACMCMLFIDAVRAFLQKLEEAAKLGDRNIQRRGMEIGDEISTWPDRFQIERLSPEAAMVFLRMRIVCAGARAGAQLAAEGAIEFKAAGAAVAGLIRESTALRKSFYDMHATLLDGL